MSPEKRVDLALRHVVDPEVGVNIVDLGLVYGVEASEERIRIAMTMTTAACPMVNYLKDQARRLVKTFVPTARSIEIDLVRDPPWNPSMMSEEARRILGR